MSLFGDHGDEMHLHRPPDEATIEGLLAGRMTTDDGDLESWARFIGELRSCADSPVPEPSPALAVVFSQGLSTDKGDLLATAASNASGPAAQVAELPKRRKG